MTTVDTSVESAYCMMLGAALGALRNARGLSRDEVRRRVPAVSRRLRRYENGETKPPVSVVVQLAELYDEDPIELLVQVAINTGLPPDTSGRTLDPTEELLAAIVHHEKAVATRGQVKRARRKARALAREAG